MSFILSSRLGLVVGDDAVVVCVDLKDDGAVKSDFGVRVKYGRVGGVEMV